MLDHKLRELADSDFYPFHMPGHKRQQTGLEDPYAIDITEIPGFDNLHDPQGLILEAMERMAGLYHAKKSYLLVGGSTCGNLTAVFSALHPHGTGQPQKYLSCCLAAAVPDRLYLSQGRADRHDRGNVDRRI